jgi:hypothetical protein
MTISSLLTLVHQRTGLLARGLAQPQLASTSADAAVLAQFAREGAIEIAQALGRIEAQARVIVESGTASYSIPLAVDAPLRVTISLDAGEGDGVKTYDLPVRDGAACRARAEAGATEVGACGFFGGRFWLDALPQVSGTAEIYYHAGSLIAESEPGTTDEGGAGEASVTIPPEVERVWVAYVVAEWLAATGQSAAAKDEAVRYSAGLSALTARGNPRRPRTGTIAYRPVM